MERKSRRYFKRKDLYNYLPKLLYFNGKNICFVMQSGDVEKMRNKNPISTGLILLTPTVFIFFTLERLHHKSNFKI